MDRGEDRAAEVDVVGRTTRRCGALADVPRKDGVRLDITTTAATASDAGKAGSVGMQATESSALEATFSNDGGSVRFGDLSARAGPDYSGESIDLAGTIEWSCGGVVP